MTPLSHQDKVLIQETRTCLRFGLCCFSCNDESTRKNIQGLLVESHQLHHRLATLLSYKKNDSKCRLFTTNLFCNLATSNTDTATVITRVIRLSPSSNEISSALQKNLTSEDNENSPMDHWHEPSWTTMIIFHPREVVIVKYWQLLPLHFTIVQWRCRWRIFYPLQSWSRRILCWSAPFCVK